MICCIEIPESARQIFLNFRIGLWARPRADVASTSFGTNYVGNVVGNASQEAEDASRQTKDKKAF